jgi:hypothetical protein
VILETGVYAQKNAEEEPSQGHEKSFHWQKIMELHVAKKEPTKHEIAMFMTVQVRI